MAKNDDRRRVADLCRNIEPNPNVAAEAEDIEIGRLDPVRSWCMVAAPELVVERALLLDRPGGESLVERRILVGGKRSDCGIQHPTPP